MYYSNFVLACTIRYSIVALERSLRSSKESQPKYCNIDDGLPLTTVCVVPVVIDNNNNNNKQICIVP